MEYKKFIGRMGRYETQLLREYCQAAEKTSGMDVWNFIMNNTAPGVDRELMEQAAIYTVNSAVYRIYAEDGAAPELLLGYSMGIYSAIACGGAVPFEDGLGLVINAYRFMKSSAGDFDGAIAVIMGMTREDVEGLVSRTGSEGLAEIANENNEHSIVVSGMKEKVEAVAALAGEEGALKVVLPELSLPYHTRFVEKGAQGFLGSIKGMKIGDLEIPYLSCINQNLLVHSQDIRNELYLNLPSNISWRRTIQKARDLGMHRFVEVGAGDGLTRVSRFIDSSLEFVCFEQLSRCGG